MRYVGDLGCTTLLLTARIEESQRYREIVVGRDNEIQQLKESTGLQALELKKWEDEQDHWLGQMKGLQDELAAAQKTQAALEEQKQENMMLKEVIDRMRFELEEMRAASNSGLTANGGASARGTISKSLGAELLKKLENGIWDGEERHEVEVQQEEDSEGGDTEGEDIVQTIITRTKRVSVLFVVSDAFLTHLVSQKVGSRAKKIEVVQLDDGKEYSDAAVQHELATNSFCVQTDPEPRPVVATSEVQTDEVSSSAMSIQTEPESVPVPVMKVEMEIQTDAPELESSTSEPPQTDEDEEPLTSSSSTLLPPTPKAQNLQQLEPSDLPPSYNQVAGEDQDALAIRVANETLKKWHKGLKLPIEPVPGGISEGAVEDWKALKEELGIECSAIDRLVESSEHTGLPRGAKEPRRNRFYNIYNTYVYGDKSGGPSTGGFSLLSGQTLFCIGVSAAVAFIVGSSMAGPHYSVPGGATYYDRAAWQSFNSIQAVGEGFPGDGSAIPFLGFLGRLSGATRTLQGRPT